MTSFKIGAKALVVLTRSDWSTMISRTKHVKVGARAKVFIVADVDRHQIAAMAAKELAKIQLAKARLRPETDTGPTDGPGVSG